MRLRRTSSGIVAIIIISLVSGACAQQITVNPQPIPQPKLSPEQLSKTPISASQVEKFRLLTTTFGWAVIEDHLFATNDAGSH